MASIPPFYLDCVVAIGTYNDKKEKVWVGTGFLVGDFQKKVDDKTSNYTPYLVTNKHVLRNLDKILVKFNPKGTTQTRDFELNAFDSNRNCVWTGHPNKNYDVAVIRINGETLEKEGLEFGLFTSDKTILTSKEMETEGITEGDGVFVLGFPMGIVEQTRQHAILRTGAISRIRDLYKGLSEEYILDAFVFPGNSGGPVILKPSMFGIEGTKNFQSSRLIGIIKSYIPYKDIAVSQQTGNARVIFEENTGLSLAEPVDHILETITEDKKIKNKT